MSPTSTTGTSAASAKPILAMSPCAQVDLGGAAGALDQHEVRLAPEFFVALEHRRHQAGLEGDIVARLESAAHSALDHQLRPDLGLRLQEHRVHVHRRRHAAGARLQRLGAADLAAIRRHGGIVAHVLRLERPHPQPPPREHAAKPGDQQRLADVRACALQHQGWRPAQYSMPSCAFTPERNGCFTRLISVTRSAASRSSGLALRPVTTTCRSGRLAEQAVHHLLDRQVVLAQHDVELVEDHEVQVGVGQHAQRLVPGGARRRDVALAILRLPGKTFAHDLDVDQIGETRQEEALAGLAPALDELHDAEPQTVPERAHRQAPGRRALALAGPGMNDQQALLDGLRRVDAVLDGLDLGHLVAVRLVHIRFARRHRRLRWSSASPGQDAIVQVGHRDGDRQPAQADRGASRDALARPSRPARAASAAPAAPCWIPAGCRASTGSADSPEACD